MLSVQSALSATANGKLEAYGAPSLSVVPSEQLRLQPTSPGYEPPEQVIIEEIAGDGEGGGEVGSEGGGSGEGGEVKLPFSSDRPRPGDGDCGEGGMPTTARSTGSH